ncbi:hypothetical protein JST97_36430 [bacterium]|nr:hypothetical protein [bacterium]
MLFPLALTPFEKAMLLFEGNSFRVEWAIEGSLRPEVVTTALNRALLRHPLLTCRLDNRKKNWMESREPLALLEELPPQPMDLEREPGLRVAFHPQRLRAEFHHAVCDGAGAQMLLRDFSQAYDEAVGGRPQPWAPVEPERLVARGRALGPERTSSIWQSLKFAAQFLCTRPFRPFEGKGPTRDPSWGWVDLAASQAWVRRHGGSLNDLALHCLFTTLEKHWPKAKKRLMMPMNTRRAADFRSGACNGTSFAFVSQRAYAELCGETEFIKQFRPDLLTLLAFGALDRVRLMPLLRWLPPQFSTAILTNMGKVYLTRPHFPSLAGKLKVGDVLVERVLGAPPLQSRTGVAVGLTQLNDRIFVAMRYGGELDQEQNLLEDYVQGWRSLISQPGPRFQANLPSG